MAHTYEVEIENVLNNTDFIKSQIFDISVSPHVDEFVKTFNFYRATLSNAKKIGVDSSYIFYYNDTSSNAKAGISKGHGIIFFNAGLIIYLIQNLLEKGAIDEIIKVLCKNVYEDLDNPGNILIYQAAQHFTFYHELGHLIQQSDDLKTFLSERTSVQSKAFDLIKHKLEIDADSFSALSIAAHIHQYIFKIFGENIESKKVESVIEIFCSGILLYFLSFESFKDDIYYEEGTHPHPIIRTFNVILIITQYCKGSPRIKAKKIEIDHFKIFNRTIEIATEIEYKAFGSKKSNTFLETLKKEKKEILEYYTKLHNIKPENFVLAENKWNETVNK